MPVTRTLTLGCDSRFERVRIASRTEQADFLSRVRDALEP
jgi:hypothetical protein